MPDLSVVIINWNTRQLLADCLNTLQESIEDISCEIIVVDNASTDGSQAMIRQNFPHVQLIENVENVGFAKANNQAMKIAKGRYFLLWNSDAFATPGAIQALLQLANSHPKAGIVGAQLLNEDSTFQASHTRFPGLWQEFLILSGLGRLLKGRWYPSHGPEEEQGPQQVDYVEGACLLVRPEVFSTVGGLDESYFMYAEEVDWCYTVQQNGWQVWYQPQARVIHLGGGSSTGRRTQREADLYRSRVQFFRKHYGNMAALLLKLLIFGLTAAKSMIHRIVRFVSRGRYGRSVVSLRQLNAELRKI